MKTREKEGDSYIKKECNTCEASAEVVYGDDRKIQTLNWKKKPKEFKEKVWLEAKENCLNNFKKGQRVEITHVLQGGKQVVLDGVALLDAEVVEKYFTIL